MDHKSILMGLGLTLTEASLYLAAHGGKAYTVQELAKKAGIKRPTVYHALATLLEKGLASEKLVGSKTKFAFSNPEHLYGLAEREREAVEEKARALETLIPLLSRGAGDMSDVPSVVHYEGLQGMKMVMDIAFHARSKKWDIIAPYSNFLREYDPEYAQRYLKARKFYGITSRTLWEGGMRPGRRLTPEEIRERNPRLMPKSMHGKFKSMMILFDDKVAIFTSYDKLTAILLTSKELHDMFSALFDGLWETSKSY